MKRRVNIILISVSIAFGILFLRSFYLQIIPNKKIENWIAKQFHSNIKINPRRPSIIDNSGRELALSVESYSIYADPSLIKRPNWVASRLALILKEPKSTILKKLKNKESRFVWIKRFLSKEARDKIQKLKLSDGIGFVSEYKRLYPNEKMLDFLIGRVGTDGNGLSGVELWIDQFIDLNSAQHRIPKDAKGRPLAISEKLLHELISEKEVHLTLDVDIQHFFEKRLRQARIEQDAKAVFAILMEIPTYEIRAMAFDDQEGSERFRLKNPLLNNVYEFGSVLKPLTIGVGLQEKMVDQNWVAHLEGGIMKVGDRKIKESHYDPKLPEMNLTQVIAKSSNIGTAKVAFKIGDQKLYEAFSHFNLNQKTGLGLPGESKGILSKPPWSKHLLANISFGQGIAITPIQLVQAWAALATDGIIRSPVIVKLWKNSLTGEEVHYKTEEKQRALSQAAVAHLRPMLESVAKVGGTGEKAKIAGYQVAGKTGTAQKAFENGRGYKPGAYLASFAGFFPAHEPKYVMLVALDEPKKDSYASSSVAPLFSELGTYVVRKQGVEPSQPEIWKNHLSNQIKINQQILSQKKLDPETVTGLPLEEALEYLKVFDVPLRVKGIGETVIKVEAQLNDDSTQPEAITITLE